MKVSKRGEGLLSVLFLPLELKRPGYLTIDIHILPAILSQSSLGNPTRPGNRSLRTGSFTVRTQRKEIRMDYISHNAKRPPLRGLPRVRRAS